jgi:hypothetical protein
VAICRRTPLTSVGSPSCQRVDLRHSYLTMLGKTADLRTVQELAGHSTPVLTARYMLKSSEDLADAVRNLPVLVGEVNAERGESGVVTGVISGHSLALSGTLTGIDDSGLIVTEMPEKEATGARKHRPASSRIEWAVPGLNRRPADLQTSGAIS